MVQLFTIINERQTGFDNLGICRIAAFLQSKNIEVKTTYLYQNNLSQEINKVDFEMATKTITKD